MKTYQNLDFNRLKRPTEKKSLSANFFFSRRSQEMYCRTANNTAAHKDKYLDCVSAAFIWLCMYYYFARWDIVTVPDPVRITWAKTRTLHPKKDLGL